MTRAYSKMPEAQPTCRPQMVIMHLNIRVENQIYASLNIKKSLVCQYYFYETGVDPIGLDRQTRTYF